MSAEAQVAWAAAIFEGEGCFAVDRKEHGSPRLRIVMTDEDVLRRFHEIVEGKGSLSPMSRRANALAHWKQPWLWTVTNVDDVREIMELFLPWLGERRTARWNELWESWQKHLRSLVKSCSACGETFTARDLRTLYCSKGECRLERNRRIARRHYTRLVKEMGR